VGIVDVCVLHSDYGLVGYSTFIVGASDLFIPWRYNTSIGGVLSLKEIDIDILNNTAILIPSLGNNFLVINSTQPLSVNITSGGIFIRTLVIGDRYITTIWAVNTTDTIIALSTEIPQNTLTPTLPQIAQTSGVKENPLGKMMSNPIITASIIVVAIVIITAIIKLILLKKKI